MGSVALVLSLACSVALAATSFAEEVALDDLSPAVEWQVGGIEVHGSEFFSGREIEKKLVTRERVWYAPWRERPVFDPATFRRDLERLQRFYEAEGFFEVQVRATLHTDGSARVFARIDVEESQRARVQSLEVRLAPGADSADPPPESLPLEVGAPFTEAAYRDSENALRIFYLNRGRALAVVERHARVSADAEHVDVDYLVRPGPDTFFGKTRVEGLEDVAEAIVRRELDYAEGEPFSLARIERTRARLLATELFASVRFEWEAEERTEGRVPVRLRIQEKPPREIRVGGGYTTDNEVTAQLRWDHYNWLGGGRQLSVAGQYSTITSSGDVAFLQPHLFSDRRNRGHASFSLFHEEEETYSLDSSRFVPSLERELTPTLFVRAGYRAQISNVSEVDPSVSQAIGGVRREGWISGLQLGVRWDRTDHPFTPSRGQVLQLQGLQAGSVWGGTYDFYRFTAAAEQYFSPGFATVLALQLELGFADAIGEEENLPIFERFYAGGETSVRGYGRRRLGPKSASDDPLGGKSLVEGSVELRRPLPLVSGLGVVAFLDFGQVSLERFDVPLDDLELSAGPGLTYDTPVGPISVYVGFPFDPPDGDRAWQLHFSIGHYF